MKTSRGFLASLVLAGIFVLGLNPLFAGPSPWPQSKGELCWTNDSNGEVIRLAVVRTIGNNYLVHGMATGEDNLATTSLVNGNAVRMGDKILMHFTASGSDMELTMNPGTYVNEAHGAVGRVIFDAATLHGHVVAIDFNCDSNTPPFCKIDDDYSGRIQTLTHISCPGETLLNGNLRKR